MKIAVSNIAWAPEQSDAVYEELQKRSVEGLVIAPTMVWPKAPEIGKAEVNDFKKRIGRFGLQVVGMQSLVFGRSDCAIFDSAKKRETLSAHLRNQATLAGRLGARTMVFGSPGLRKPGTMPKWDQLDMAADAFEPVLEVCKEEGVTLCIEPLSGYGNEFITTTEEGVGFVSFISHESFGLHLDSAAIAGSGEDYASTIRWAHSQVGVKSFDASAPGLALPSQDATVDHTGISRVLRKIGYDGYVSLEMSGPNEPDAVMKELENVQTKYGIMGGVT